MSENDITCDDNTLVLVINRVADGYGASYTISGILDGRPVLQRFDPEPGVNEAPDFATVLDLFDPQKVLLDAGNYVG